MRAAAGRAGTSAIGRRVFVPVTDSAQAPMRLRHAGRCVAVAFPPRLRSDAAPLEPHQ